MDIKTAIVVGAGQMGSGIAQVVAVAGVDIVLTDVSDDLVERGVSAVRASLNRAVESGRLGRVEREGALARISTCLTQDVDCGADICIEAATEDLAVKRGILAQIVPSLGKDAIVASNTSSLSITELGALAGCPDRFVGMHFFNPVPTMVLVEIVKGLLTSEETVATVEAFARRIGKTPAVVNDSPGFIVNRVLLPMINEAAYALLEGVGDACTIDAAMVAGANHPMGPLALADLIGLDTVLAVLEVLHRDLGDPKYRPCPLLRRYVSAGLVGRKSGEGFFGYA